MTLTKEENDKLQGLDCHQVRMWLEATKLQGLPSLTDGACMLTTDCPWRPFRIEKKIAEAIEVGLGVDASVAQVAETMATKVVGDGGWRRWSKTVPTAVAGDGGWPVTDNRQQVVAGGKRQRAVADSNTGQIDFLGGPRVAAATGGNKDKLEKDQKTCSDTKLNIFLSVYDLSVMYGLEVLSHGLELSISSARSYTGTRSLPIVNSVRPKFQAFISCGVFSRSVLYKDSVISSSQSCSKDNCKMDIEGNSKEECLMGQLSIGVHPNILMITESQVENGDACDLDLRCFNGLTSCGKLKGFPCCVNTDGCEQRVLKVRWSKRSKEKAASSRGDELRRYRVRMSRNAQTDLKKNVVDEETEKGTQWIESEWCGRERGRRRRIVCSWIPLNGYGSESGKSETSEGEANDSVTFGDIIFIKLRGSSWWPAQVVDENSVNKSVKPSKRSKRSPGDILVRHYGSYI
ncbi:hypothetical protein V8G54_008278 [Vigna mungo]|uniref:PWWP domain-containing protein n=1 Tax=Vigna mungo TaxID=3915 RepID=A0AAQ3S9R0_VIGMU